MRNKLFFILILVLSFGLSSISAQTAKPKIINAGVINGKAESLPKPEYPAAAKAVKASGVVNVQIMINEEGSVISAKAVSGDPLLRQAAEQAALKATFKPTISSGQPVTVSGLLVYDFIGTFDWLRDGIVFGLAETLGIKAKVWLPDGSFSDEREQLNKITDFSLEEKKAQIPVIIASIKSKLNPTDLWRFEFGLAKGRIFGNLGDGNTIALNLAKIKELSLNRADGIQEQEFNRAVELAKLAGKENLTAEDKELIVKY